MHKRKGGVVKNSVVYSDYVCVIAIKQVFANTKEEKEERREEKKKKE